MRPSCCSPPFTPDDAALCQGVHTAAAQCEAFQQTNRAALENVAALEWEDAVVLADGPLCGIAEEGALAFTEISMLCGRYFHLLDYRHGPIVISRQDTLTLMVLRPGEEDSKSHGGGCARTGRPLLTISDRPGNPWGGVANLQIEAWPPLPPGASLYLCGPDARPAQALRLGRNPDAPKGLDPYITLQ